MGERCLQGWGLQFEFGSRFADPGTNFRGKIWRPRVGASGWSRISEKLERKSRDEGLGNPWKRYVPVLLYRKITGKIIFNRTSTMPRYISRPVYTVSTKIRPYLLFSLLFSPRYMAVVEWRRNYDLKNTFVSSNCDHWKEHIYWYVVTEKKKKKKEK